ncbi:MAG: S10 family peptidase [Terriglobales bacterium]
MRVFVVTFTLLCALFAGAAAQQANSSNDEPKEKKSKSTESKNQEKKPSQAAEKTTEPAPAAEEQKPAASKPGTDKDKEEFDVSEVAPVVTHHQLTLDGKLLKYTATTGRLPIKRGDGKIEAEMFFVAYTLDGQDAGKRPLTFAFNGGPGSATIWLHMGALGPKHVMMQADGLMPPAPYRIADNPSTLLDKSDVVFVDAISTGFSRAANAELSKKFLGVKGDIEAFSEFIRLYLTRYERWSSPLFLFGESYGTTRAAGIAGNLADQGISFNGITLLSTALSFQTLVDNRSNDQPYVLLIPTFTMIAGYHKKLPPDLAQDMVRARQESEQWASTDYTQALAKGDALSADERQKAIDQMARYTGLSKEVIDQANLRIDVPKFTHYLLLDQKLRVGRLDGRFTGPDPDGLLDTPFYDPTESAIMGPYTAVFNNYVRTELGYKTDMPYQVFPADQNFFENAWNWGSGIAGFPDTATALRQAIVKDPYLKVLVMEGYYDLATPFYAADYTINHLNLSPQYRKNISFATYEAGHMVYLPTDGLKKLKGDEAGFIDRSMAGN